MLFSRWSWTAPHLERCARDDRLNQRTEAEVFRPRLANDPAHRRLVIILHAAPQREREQFLSKSTDEDFRAFEQRGFKATDAIELAAIRQSAGRIHRLAFVHRAPAPNRV